MCHCGAMNLNVCRLTFLLLRDHPRRSFITGSIFMNLHINSNLIQRTAIACGSSLCSKSSCKPVQSSFHTRLCSKSLCKPVQSSFYTHSLLTFFEGPGFWSSDYPIHKIWNATSPEIAFWFQIVRRFRYRLECRVDNFHHSYLRAIVESFAKPLRISNLEVMKLWIDLNLSESKRIRIWFRFGMPWWKFSSLLP